MEYPNDPYDGIEPRAVDSKATIKDLGPSLKDRLSKAQPGAYIYVSKEEFEKLTQEDKDTFNISALKERARTASERLKWDDFSKDRGPRTTDMVNHPPHYTKGGIETIDYMEAKSTPEEFKGHLRLTAIKYLSRAGDKDDILQEYEKAEWYIKRLIETIKKERGIGL